MVDPSLTQRQRRYAEDQEEQQSDFKREKMQNLEKTVKPEQQKLIDQEEMITGQEEPSKPKQKVDNRKKRLFPLSWLVSFKTTILVFGFVIGCLTSLAVFKYQELQAQCSHFKETETKRQQTIDDIKGMVQQQKLIIENNLQQSFHDLQAQYSHFKETETKRQQTIDDIKGMVQQQKLVIENNLQQSFHDLQAQYSHFKEMETKRQQTIDDIKGMVQQQKLVIENNLQQSFHDLQAQYSHFKETETKRQQTIDDIKGMVQQQKLVIENNLQQNFHDLQHSLQNIKVILHQQTQELEDDLQQCRKGLELFNSSYLFAKAFAFKKYSTMPKTVHKRNEVLFSEYHNNRWMFDMKNFSVKLKEVKLKEVKLKEDKSWDSPAMYTHMLGYKFIFRIYPCGLSYSSSDVDVQIFGVPGEFDGLLKWPAEARFNLQLVGRNGTNATGSSFMKTWEKPSAYSNSLIGYIFDIVFHSEVQNFLYNDTLQFMVDVVLP